MHLDDYHARALAHLATVEPRPMEPMPRHAAATYHRFGDSPEEAAEFWADCTLYAMERTENDEVRMTAAEMRLEADLDACAAFHADAYDEW